MWADPALVSDAAALLVGHAHQHSHAAFPPGYVIESSSSLAHWSNSHCRAGGAGKNPCANLTCVNSPSLTFPYGAEVWDFGIGGSKWESV